MIRIIIGCFLVLLSSIGFCYKLPTVDELVKLENERYQLDVIDGRCKYIQQLSESIMDGRQKGLAIEFQLNLMNKESDKPLPYVLKQKEKNLILKAYEIPQFNKENERYLVRTEFSLKSYLDCKKNGL